jgi:3-phytase
MGVQRLFGAVIAAAAALSQTAAAAVEVDVPVSALTAEVESDWSAVYYSKASPLLLGNDGSAASGGFLAWALDGATPLPQASALVTGRTKLVTTIYGVGGRDLAVTIAQPDSIVRVFELPSFKQLKDVELKVLGDWSALCAWKSQAANQYLFLFGKRQAVQFLVQKSKGSIEIFEASPACLPPQMLPRAS